MGGSGNRKTGAGKGEPCEPEIWTPRKARLFQAALLAWYRRHRRQLPWRSEPSAYRVWISEIMLQQTQVRTALPFFERFISRFPDLATLAAASEEEVLEHWAGLGYYRRARHLHRAARIIAVEKGGRFPDTMEEILRLPGIGRYAAGAILSIAFNQSQPVVDGNVRRVISRLHALDRPLAESFFWRQASAWLPKGAAADFNQAVMELGALVCVTPKPRCPGCPAARLCAARRLGLQDRIPKPREARDSVEAALVLAVIVRDGSLLLSRRQPLPYIPGTWGLPAASVPGGRNALKLARRLLREAAGCDAMVKECRPVRHGITHHKISARIFRAVLPAAYGDPASGFRWHSLQEASRLLTSSLYHKALRSAGIAHGMER